MTSRHSNRTWQILHIKKNRPLFLHEFFSLRCSLQEFFSWHFPLHDFVYFVFYFFGPHVTFLMVRPLVLYEDAISYCINF